jgi:hypothetical protein
MNRKNLWICAATLIAVGGLGLANAATWLPAGLASVSDDVASQISGGQTGNCGGVYQSITNGCCGQPSKIVQNVNGGLTQMYCNQATCLVYQGPGINKPQYPSDTCRECGRDCGLNITSLIPCNQ